MVPGAYVVQSLDSKHQEPHVRGLAAVLLRRALLLEEPTLWDCLQRTGGSGSKDGNGLEAGMEGSSGQREFQAHLLRVLSDETDASVRRKVWTILNGDGKGNIIVGILLTLVLGSPSPTLPIFLVLMS